MYQKTLVKQAIIEKTKGQARCAASGLSLLSAMFSLVVFVILIK
jgi:hypothetical protein